MIIRNYEDHRRICIQVIIKACATEFKLSNPSKTATIDDVKDTNDKSAINELILVNDEKQKDRKINAVLKKYDSKLIGNNIQWRIRYIHIAQNDSCFHQIIISKYDSLSEEQQMEITKEAIKLNKNF